MSAGLPMWVIYDHPKDFPNEYVARLWDGAKPTAAVLRHPALPALMRMLRQRDPNLVRFTRAENDDPTIIEVWL